MSRFNASLTRTGERLALPKATRSLILVVILCVVVGVACRRPQELPVVVSVNPESAMLQWRDARGSLSGEVPWVLRTDLLGPDTFLVVETDDGDRCVRTLSFRVRAGGATEYTVTLVSDLEGRISWRVTHGEDTPVKLFTCAPRPADDPRQECLAGGIPKPLLGELVGSISAELEGGALARVSGVRFERAFPCAAAGSGIDGRRTPGVIPASPDGAEPGEPR